MKFNNFKIPEKYKDLPVAVCCVIRKESQQLSKLLLVSRKDDPTSFGLPGGKIDPGETPQQAIVREVQEETGLSIELGPCIYKKMCPKHAPEGQDYYAFAFIAKSYSGDLATQEKGVVKWGTWSDQEEGMFAQYNRGVRSSLHDYDWYVDAWNYLSTEEEMGMGIPLLKALLDSPANAEELAKKLNWTAELTTNALLNLRNAYFVDGLEGFYFRITLRGKTLLSFETLD